MEPQTPNAVCIYPYNKHDDRAETRDNWRCMMDSYLLKVDEFGRMVDGEVEDLLNAKDTSVVGHFFDRNQDEHEWYYSIIARRKDGDPVNDIATRLVKKDVGAVRGPVLIVKDCPQSHWDKMDKGIDVEAVCKTIWYYAKSGVCPTEEYGTRTLIRLLSEGVV